MMEASCFELRSGPARLLARSKHILIGRFGALPWPPRSMLLCKRYLPSATATSHASLLSGLFFLDWNLF